MLIEFIIDKDDYKSSIKKINFTASNGVIVSKRSLKANGKENYYFRMTCLDDNIESAKALSEIRCLIESEFKTNQIDDYRILIDESSQYFTRELYPLIMEFETKLRKFIHNTLFDISEISEQRVVAQLITSLNLDIKNKDIPKSDFLELASLEKIHLFLFQNNELFGDVKKYIGDRNNCCATKEELIEYISNNDKGTVWGDLFASDFADSTLPKMFEDIIALRNDVMHFHYISFERYDNGVKLIKSAIQDLDKQIKKGVVIENTDSNVAKLTSNSSYWQSVLLGLQGLDEIRSIASKSLVASTIALSPISDILTDINRNLVMPTLNSEIAGIISPLNSSMRSLLKIGDIGNIPTNFSGVYSSVLPPISTPIKKATQPDD